MSRRTLLAVFAAVLLASPFSSANAAITAEGDISPSTDPADWHIYTVLLIGTSSSGTLTIDGSSGLGSAGGDIGCFGGAFGFVTITGAGSHWTSTQDFKIGTHGNGSLSVLAGGTASCYYSACIGQHSGSSGTLTVDGLGSKWSSRDLQVGVLGTGTLNISNGGVVSVADWISVSGSASSINFGPGGGTLTTATLWALPSQLTGAGRISLRGIVSDIDLNFDAATSYSVAFGSGGTMTVNMYTSSGSGDLGVGYTGSASMAVKNAASIYSVNAYLGYNSGSSGTATVDGAGSKWTNSGDFYAGREGNGTLNVIGGGISTAVAYLGFGANSSGSASVSGPGSTWSCKSLELGCSGSGRLDITGGGTVSNSTVAYLGHNAGSSGTATVDGAGSAWTNANSLYVGGAGSGTLNITNGGSVRSSSGYIGDSASSSGLATVDGPGSNWASSGNLFVGRSGSGTLTISNGGSVSSSSGYVGYSPGSSGLATVDGPGSTWANSFKLNVGGNSGNATLNISNGGAVTVTGTTTLDGIGSAVNFGPGGGTLTTTTLCAPLSQLQGAGLISSRGLLCDFDLTFDAIASCSVAFGTGGTLTVDMSAASGNGELGMGYANTGSLVVTSGARIYSENGYFGYKAGSSGSATVHGAGSNWTNALDLYVGRDGNGTLNVTEGGVVSDYCGYIGCSSNSAGTATVNGSGSTWINRDNLYVGHSGNGTLVISNGGSVSSSDGRIGYSYNSSGTVTVDGAGSTWTTGDYLYVGTAGAGALNITNGGSVGNSNGYVDGYPSASTATVDGAGSTWTNSNGLFVGSTAKGALSVANGGTVSSFYAYIGYSSTGSGTVTVDGPSSKWTNASSLDIGKEGKGALNIINGGTVNSLGGCLGYSRGASGTLTVDGAGSIWTNSSYLYVGESGTGTVSITNGGTVNSAGGYIGYYNNSSGTVALDGPSSAWINGNNLSIGYYGKGVFTQTGGANSISGSLDLAHYSAGKGTYNLNGGVLVLNSLTKGAGTALFNFGGGTLQAGATISSSVPISLTGIGGSANVNTNGHSITLSGLLSGPGGLSKSGAGTLKLAAANNYSGPTAVTAGAIELAPAAQNVVFALGGADIQGGKMIFDYGAASSPAATIVTLLTASCHGGLWDVGQFRSSTAAANGLTLGWFDDGSSAVAVMATYPGDFNLDGVVADADLDVWKANAGRSATWQTGDANYDGVVNLLDLDLWKANVGRSALSGAALGGESGAELPEPGTLAMLAAGLIALLARRWRRRP